MITKSSPLGARARSVVAVLDGNAWLTARIFGVLQIARKDLLQVTRYLTEDGLRAAVQARVAALLDDDTQLVIGHSLGSVVAWEACWALGQPLPVLVTLGSPLGLDNVVYPRLCPQPPTWPELVNRWVNIAHPDDVVAVDPDLGRLFPAPNGLTIETHTPRSKYEHHAATGYLGEQATGRAVADALGG
jgi:pimeloyl-ACP methyl ester carboxylesterase